MTTVVKFTVKHTCGHEATHAVSGSAVDRKQREEWLKRQPCQACWRAQQAEEASAKRGEWDLPELEGTDDQKAWAEVIRTKALAHSKEFYERLTNSSKVSPDDEELRGTIISAAHEALEELENQHSASWWIDNRFDALSHVKKRIATAIAPILAARGES